ncbi:MAG TPA: retropepsin-like aspartic protease [Xanthobacteraceae bacterium]|nr:retropepsin-like aspartic protease [Xanthobacteraceae bacterium]
MLRGRLGITSGAPYIEARISFPRLRLQGLVLFLIDTGADGTVLMPADSKRIGIDFRALRNRTVSEGIGGAANGFSEHVVLSFSDRRSIYSYDLPIEISAPTSHNHRFPSLLGRDILKQWRLVMDAAQRSITCTPRTWDLRQKI